MNKSSGSEKDSAPLKGRALSRSQLGWYRVIKATVSPWLYSLNRVGISGRENIPDNGAVILAPNHVSVMDSLYLPLRLKRQVRTLAKQEYFLNTGIVGKIQKFIFTSVGQVPVDRSAAGDSAVEAACGLLEQGEVFSIYPEGTRSPDGRLYRGRTGMARIAMATGAPVVPVALFGSRKANPIGTWIPRPVKVRIVIGTAIDPHKWARDNGFDPASREVSRPFTDYFMGVLKELTGLPYVEMYASDVKQSLAEGRGYPEGTEPGGSLEIPGTGTPM